MTARLADLALVAVDFGGEIGLHGLRGGVVQVVWTTARACPDGWGSAGYQTDEVTNVPCLG